MISYIIVIYVLAYVLQFVGIKMAKRPDNPDPQGRPSRKLLALVMAIPSIVLIVFVFLGQVPPNWSDFGLTMPSFAHWVLGFFTPIIYMTIMFAILKPFSKVDKIEVTSDGKWHIPGVNTIFNGFIKKEKRTNIKKPVVYILDFLVSTLVLSLMSLVFALGEELAWRGFMQPIFIERFGVALGITLLGIVWGFWHFPLNVVGYNDAKNPKLNAFILFTIQTIALSFIFGWLRITTGNIWAASLAHAAHNVSEGVGRIFIIPRIGNVKYRIIETAVYVLFGAIAFVLIHMGV
ncbi:MAG: CPBP family intramembrane metalloprotease [Defluviitaleaceae bacterium]|nr:CPBP family intramembrane metalloprotease [Defluviitaleaceae bacterium]